MDRVRPRWAVGMLVCFGGILLCFASVALNRFFSSEVSD
jgi:hypothetical protein